MSEEVKVNKLPYWQQRLVKLYFPRKKFIEKDVLESILILSQFYVAPDLPNKPKQQDFLLPTKKSVHLNFD